VVFNTVDDVKKCLVKILSLEGHVKGTGFLVGEGYVLTARHLVSQAINSGDTVPVICLDHPKTPHEASVVAGSENYDCAVLRIESLDYPALPLADAGENKLGDGAWVYGFQLAEQLDESPYLADVLISAWDAEGSLVLDSALLPGMSGAPVFNLTCRKVVGVVTARFTRDGETSVNHTALAVSSETIVNEWPWLRAVNDRVVKRQQIDSFNHFKSEIMQILQEDLDMHVDPDVVIDGVIVDAVAHRTLMGRSQRTAVQCHTGRLSPESVRDFGSLLVSWRGQGKVDDGRIITAEVIPDEIQSLAAKFPLSCISRDDLENEALGLSRYVQRLIDDYESFHQADERGHSPLVPEMAKYNVRQYYVDVNATDDQEQRYEPVDQFFSRWLSDEQGGLVSVIIDGEHTPSKQVSILGDSGSGKTSFCLHLAYKVACRWRDERTGRVPLYIPLKGYSADGGIDALVNIVVRDTYKLQTSAAGVLRHTVKRGRFLLIFDGFDEMRGGDTEEETRRRYKEIRKFARDQGKVVLTCRSNFFRLAEEVRRILAPTDVAPDLLRRSKRRDTDILYIEPFEESQILEFLSRHPHIAGREQEWLQCVQRATNLRALSERPILLRMLVDTVPSLEHFPESLVSIAELYMIFVESLLARDQESGRVLVLSSRERLSILRALALSLLVVPGRGFCWTALPPLAEAFLDQLRQQKRPDWVDYDVRNSPLLQRQGDRFEFIHESFTEFFAAYDISEYLSGLELEDRLGLFQAILREGSAGEGVRRFVVGIIGFFQGDGRFSYQCSAPEGSIEHGMLLVPLGPFISGGYGTPLVIKELDKSILISKYPVTWREYEMFDPNHRKRLGIEANDLSPVTLVSWENIMSYCDWLSQQRGGKAFRLPTEDEWEKAARGVDGRLYPWGDSEVTLEKANWGYKVGKTTPVNSYEAGISPYGLWDMAGNVFEITSTSPDHGVSHICRGGSWEDPPSRLQCAARHLQRFDAPSLNVGFRVALDLEPR